MADDTERLAAKFHEAYERLAPRYGYKTRDESAVEWARVPEANRRLMVAAAGEAAADLLARCRLLEAERDKAKQQGREEAAEAIEEWRDRTPRNLWHKIQMYAGGWDDRYLWLSYAADVARRPRGVSVPETP